MPKVYKLRCSIAAVRFTPAVAVFATDDEVTEVTTKAQLRIRALLMEHLAVDCYGGTTFKFDNYVVTNFVTSTVFMHGGQFKVTRPPKQPYTRYPPPSLLAEPSTGPPSPTETSSNKERPSSACSAPQSRVMRHAKNLLPHGSYSIPLPNMKCSAVLVSPPTPNPCDPPKMCWPPQVLGPSRRWWAP